METQREIQNGTHLCAAIQDQRCYATCSPFAVEGCRFGYDAGQAGRSYSISSFDTQSGIPSRFAAVRGVLTGRYVVPMGCKRNNARWECRGLDAYFWVSLDD